MPTQVLGGGKAPLNASSKEEKHWEETTPSLLSSGSNSILTILTGLQAIESGRKINWLAVGCLGIKADRVEVSPNTHKDN